MARNRSNDPFYQIYRNNTDYEGPRGGQHTRPGFMEHRDVLEMYEYDLDLDERQRLQMWADYTRYMVGKPGEAPYRRNDQQNPFFQRWGINPDTFDWHGWREAMGYPEGGRR